MFVILKNYTVKLPAKQGQLYPVPRVAAPKYAYTHFMCTAKRITGHKVSSNRLTETVAKDKIMLSGTPP